MLKNNLLKIQRKFLSEAQFIQKWNQFKHDLVEKFENEFQNDQIIEDVEEVSELVKIQLWDNRVIIVNRQTPNREIWLSSPISGPSHFRFDELNNKWITKNNMDFYTIFEADMKEILNKQLQNMNQKDEVLQAYLQIQQQIQKKQKEQKPWSEQLQKLNIQSCSLHLKQAKKRCRKCQEIIQQLNLRKNQSYSTDQNNLNKEQNIKRIQKDILGDFNFTLKQNIQDYEIYNQQICNFVNLKQCLEYLNSNFDSYQGWINSSKGIPSIFWSIFYQIILINPDIQQCVQLIKTENLSTCQNILLILYIRYSCKEIYIYPQMVQLFNCQIILKINDHTKIGIKDFCIDLIDKEKIFGFYLPQISLIGFRKIKMIQLSEIENIQIMKSIKQQNVLN